jgi:hypothetical protein
LPNNGLFDLDFFKDISALVSSERLLPYKADFSLIYTPFKALIILALVSSECLRPKELPAIFNVLYLGFNASR